MHALLLLYCYIGLSLVFGEGAQPASHNELLSLLSIKSSLIDPLDHLKDWKLPINGVDTDLIHCNWTGIWCNSDGLVEKLDLSYMNLSGRVSEKIQELRGLTSLNLCCNGFDSVLPGSISNLTSLRGIDLSQNYFFDEFPRGFGKATGLTSINASTNNFSGFLPADLGNLTSLEVLDFRGSFFEGSIPDSFANLQRLRFLGLSGNNLTGKMPREISNLSNLETIILGYNEFEGEIPAEFGNLTNLRYLDLAVGNLNGRIPPDLGKLQKLTTIFLYKNSFEGKIPPEIGNITSLLFLDLSDNQFSAAVPQEIAELKNLQLLNLMCNQLNGTIPDKLSGLTKLEVLALWKNSFTGNLPMDLGQNSPMQWLDVSSNSFSGEIPPSLCRFGNLTKIIIFNNSFSGPIPISLSNCSSLVRVRAQNNFISGTIPKGFGNLPKLQRFELAKNNLTGEIPEDFGFSTSISFIDLSHNSLESSLPPSIFSLPNLQSFLASNNYLEGQIPDEFQDCLSLSVLDLSENHFSGKIPESIASCQKLVTLNLRENNFIGEIPQLIMTMPSLAILDLSNNSLVGQIPFNFGNSPALESLNLSYNKLVGPIPTSGVFSTINPKDLIGNDGLCGGILRACTPVSNMSLGQQSKAHVNRLIIRFVLVCFIIFALGIIYLGLRWLYKRWYLYNSFFRNWPRRKDGDEWPWRLIAFQRLNFTSNDILASIKEYNVIGLGGAGVVYKAEILRPPHMVVAVKKLWQSGENLLEEVNLLGRLRHRNITRILGYLYNENNVIMVQEYMQNGNLGTALHDKTGAKFFLDWISRYNVALGVAQGLRYLHDECRPPVVHRDIKPSNILLDDNFEPRIADFGLARIMVEKNKMVSMAEGSYGYIAPEYAYTLKVDEKSDIYSYGVILLELLTGRKPVDPSFGDPMHIVEWVQWKVRDNRALDEVLDSNVAGQCKHVQEEMLLVLRIALLCTANLPKERPSIRDIITMLGEAKPRRKSIYQSSNMERPIFSPATDRGLL